MISKRLGRMSTRRWDRAFGTVSLLFYGGAIGGAVALIPFLSVTPSPTHTAKVQYVGLLIIAAFIATVCLAARLAINSEREDSVAAIKEDLDEILQGYPDLSP